MLLCDSIRTMHDLATFTSIVGVGATRSHVCIFEKKRSQTRAVPAPSTFWTTKISTWWPWAGYWGTLTGILRLCSSVSRVSAKDIFSLRIVKTKMQSTGEREREKERNGGRELSEIIVIRDSWLARQCSSRTRTARMCTMRARDTFTFPSFTALFSLPPRELALFLARDSRTFSRLPLQSFDFYGRSSSSSFALHRFRIISPKYSINVFFRAFSHYLIFFLSVNAGIQISRVTECVNFYIQKLFIRSNFDIALSLISLSGKR